MNSSTQQRISTTRLAAALVAAVGAALCALGYWVAPHRFFEAYLFAFLVVSGIGLGCLALVMLYGLVGGKWGAATQPILEATAWPLVVAPLLALPLAPGLDALYPWTDASVVQHDSVLAKKTAYLNTDFFLARALAYLLLWAIFALLLTRRSRAARNDGPTRDYPGRRSPGLCALGLVVYVLTMTFASIDWMMSLEPHWFSAIYGVIVIAGQGAAAFAAAIVTLAWLPTDSQPPAPATKSVFHDLGNLLLAAVTFWLYVVFSQYLIIWSGNLPEEIPWYLARARGGWSAVALLLVLLHFAVPFATLLSPAVKRSPRFLAGVALLVLIMHVVDVYWLVMPALRRTLALHWLDFIALIAMGALWKAVGLWRLGSLPLAANNNAAPQEISHADFSALEQPG